MAIADLFKGINTEAFVNNKKAAVATAMANNMDSMAALMVEAQFRDDIKAILPEKLGWMAESKSIVELGFMLTTMTKTVFGTVLGTGCALPYWYVTKDGEVSSNLDREEVKEPDMILLGIWLQLVNKYPALPIMSLEELREVFTKKMDLALAAKNEYETNLVLDDEEADI